MADSNGTLKKVAIGVTVLAVVGVSSLLLSDEPPIKVRGGGLEIEVSGEDGDSWADSGNDWKLKSDGTNWSGKYNFTIVVGSNCTSSGTPPPEVELVKIDLAGKEVAIKRHISAFLKTKITPKGDFSLVPSSKDKLLTNPKVGPVTITARPPGAPNDGSADWKCTFPVETFQELCVYKKKPCT